MTVPVELRPAYAWDCPDCGREVFERGLVPEMGKEDQQELRERFGVEVYEKGNFQIMPELVQCPHCNQRFETVHFKDSDDDPEEIER